MLASVVKMMMDSNEVLPDMSPALLKAGKELMAMGRARVVAAAATAG